MIDRTDAEYLRLRDDASTGLDGSPGNDTSKYAVDTIDALERENNQLHAENQRLFDLVRYQRAELHQAELISDDEYTRLLADSKSKARLESYDDMRKEITRLRATLQEIADYDEQSIWNDDRDDAAYGMLDLAREALKQK